MSVNTGGGGSMAWRQKLGFFLLTKESLISQGQVPIFNGRDERFSFGHLACVFDVGSKRSVKCWGVIFSPLSATAVFFPRHITTLSPLSPPHPPHTLPHKPSRSVRE